MRAEISKSVKVSANRAQCATLAREFRMNCLDSLPKRSDGFKSVDNNDANGSQLGVTSKFEERDAIGEIVFFQTMFMYYRG